MRLWQLFQVGRLGDPAVLPDLTRGLADPPSSPGWKPYEREGFLAEVADLLAQYDYRPGVSALRRLNNPPRPALQWLNLHILQLQGDVASLEARTREKDAAGQFAVRALYRMRARDALTRIASDPRHPRSSLARHYLGMTVRL